MLKGKSLKEVWSLVKWAIKLDVDKLDPSKAFEIAKANRVLLEAIIGMALIFSLLFILFFKIPVK